MEKQVAEALMQQELQLSAQLNLIAENIDERISGEELAVMRRHIASMMAASDEHLFRPILKQYPELEPHW